MEQFIHVFQKLVQQISTSGKEFTEWKDQQGNFSDSSLQEFVTRVETFATLYSHLIQYTNQLAYFFFREELQWKEFLDNPEALIEDPVFQYEKTPLRLREAQSLHLLHQYAWYQVLRKMAQLDPVKGSLVFLLPPSGVRGELEQPDYLPECILMEAGLHEEQPVFYCWHVRLPDEERFQTGEGEALTRLYDHMIEAFPPKEPITLEEYLMQMKDNHKERKTEKGFENVSTFTGSRQNENTHVYFLYWTEFYVYMCTLNRAQYQENFTSRVRKNSMIPLNTIFCEASEYRKFRLDFYDEIIAHMEKK